MSPVAFTLDLEDHRPDDTAEVRFPAVTDALLDDLEEWGVIGTVFVVGEVVRDQPDRVARVAARGIFINKHTGFGYSLQQGDHLGARQRDQRYGTW